MKKGVAKSTFIICTSAINYLELGVSVLAASGSCAVGDSDVSPSSISGTRTWWELLSWIITNFSEHVKFEKTLDMKRQE